jgi:hypothetical protein
MVAGTVAPLEECLVLGWRRAMTTNVAVGEHVNDFRVGRRALDPAMFVTSAEDVGLKSHGVELFDFIFFERWFGRSLYFMPNFQEIENRDANPSSVMLPVMASCGISR